MKKYYCVYIITNRRNTVIYTGVTGNIITRTFFHKNKFVSSFSSKYNLDKLVYYEIFEDVNQAIKEKNKLKQATGKRKLT